MYISVNHNAIGCMLGQKDEKGKERAVYYLSKRFSSCEQNYTLIEKTCCALAWAALKLQQYLHDHTTYLISWMDPIKYIFSKPILNCRLSKWQSVLQQVDILYVPQKAIKGQGIADQLSEALAGGFEPLETYFPDNDVMMTQPSKWESACRFWKIYFDAAMHADGAGAGAVLVSITGRQYPVAVKLQFSNSNNTAEYEGCILGLQFALSMGIQRLAVFGDSELVIRQTMGIYGTKELHLIPYHRHVVKLPSLFQDITFLHVPRNHNDFADALATLASLVYISSSKGAPAINFTVQHGLAYGNGVGEISDERSLATPPWFQAIKEYLQDGSFPAEASQVERRRIPKMAMNFYLSGDTLYKKDVGIGLLRCLDRDQAQRLMDEVHGGVCGPHMSGPLLTKKILRTGHYWLSLKADCDDHVRRCYQCQVHANALHAPPNELHCMTSPWPFPMWGMDVIGPIEPKASNGHRFIFTVID